MTKFYTVLAVRRDNDEIQKASCRSFSLSIRGDERVLILFRDDRSSEGKTLYLEAYQTVEIYNGNKRFWTWDGRHAYYV